jgi:hypothetical protein
MWNMQFPTLSTFFKAEVTRACDREERADPQNPRVLWKVLMDHFPPRVP